MIGGVSRVALLAVAAFVGTVLVVGCAAPGAHKPKAGDASSTAARPLVHVPATSAAGLAFEVTRPSTDEVVAAAKRLIHENDGGVREESIRDVKIVRDGRGRWWASGIGVPAASAKLEEVNIYLYREGGEWSLFDLGTGIDASELPTDVRDGL